MTQINKLYKEEIINSTIAVFSTRFNFPAPTFCPTIADRAACNAITGKIKITFIFAAIPTAADAYTPRRFATAIKTTNEKFNIKFWKAEGIPIWNIILIFSWSIWKLESLKSNGKSILRK